MDRRTTIKWVMAASAAWPLLNRPLARAQPAQAAQGYGTDPKVMENYRPGELWPLTLSAAERRLAGVLSDLIIPADGHSPAASAVGVVDFLDEWVSAPYPDHRKDRDVVVAGLAWLDGEAGRRSGTPFVDLAPAEQLRICDALCDEAKAPETLRTPARFFARYRDLTAGAFYSTPLGRKDLNYIGNVPLARFEGPPPELLKALGLP
jgi:hypothetical protein